MRKTIGHHRKIRKIVLISGLALAVTLGLLHRQILTGLAAFMTVRDPLQVADLILPLYQEGDTVPFAAADLYRRGYAERVAVVSTKPNRLEALSLIPPPHQVWRAVLEARGVPAVAIITIGSEIQNMRELAQALKTYLKNRRKTRVIVVASSPLSRISRYDLHRWLAGSSVEVRIYPVPPREFDEKTWWKSRHGWITYFDAYFLFALRLVRD